VSIPDHRSSVARDRPVAKNPVKVRVGKLGAAARWGPRRRFRLDELEPSVRAAVLALIEADAAAKKAAADQDPATAGVDGGTRDAAPTG
jgi:hypothetical protein